MGGTSMDGNGIIDWRRLFLTIAVISSVVLLVCLTSCRTVRETEEIRITKTDTLYKSLLVRDSVYVRDSLVLREKGDTVFSEKWHTKYIDRLRTDTLYKVKTDSVIVEVEKVKSITRMERFKMFLGDAGITTVLGVVVWLVILLLKWYAKVVGTRN